LYFVPADIFVPPEQVLDTVDLYYSPTRQRKMSLRFLAWFLLKNDIQLGEHDSIEVRKSPLLYFRALALTLVLLFDFFRMLARHCSSSRCTCSSKQMVDSRT